MPEESKFQYQLEKTENFQIYHFQGNLMDSAQKENFIAEFTDSIEDNELVILNLKDLHYINSNGLNLFISLITKARIQGSDLVLCEINEKIKKLLLMTKLDTVFEIYDTLEDAKNKITKVKD